MCIGSCGSLDTASYYHQGQSSSRDTLEAQRRGSCGGFGVSRRVVWSYRIISGVSIVRGTWPQRKKTVFMITPNLLTGVLVTTGVGCFGASKVWSYRIISGVSIFRGTWPQRKKTVFMITPNNLVRLSVPLHFRRRSGVVTSAPVNFIRAGVSCAVATRFKCPDSGFLPDTGNVAESAFVHVCHVFER